MSVFCLKRAYNRKTAVMPSLTMDALQRFDVASDDPTISPAVGEPLFFKGIRARFPGYDATFGQPPDLAQFQGLLLFVGYTTGEKTVWLGTAVMVGAGVAICAAHVVRPFESKLATGGAIGMFVGLASHGAETWRPVHVTAVEPGEIFILTITYAGQLPPSRTFHLAAITTRLPSVGERLFMAGFRASANEFLHDHSVPTAVGASLLVSNGLILEIYANGMRNYKPWPTLIVDAATVSGMSGGAVFDSRGFLVGLISSSFELEKGELPTPTFIALTWSVLGAHFQGMWPPVMPGPHNLIDMAARGYSFIERAEAVQRQVVDGQVRTAYAPWS